MTSELGGYGLGPRDVVVIELLHRNCVCIGANADAMSDARTETVADARPVC
jgi:hypothetical protein